MEDEARLEPPRIVGQLLPNAFGLFDMLGNVNELCSDWFQAGYYLISPADDPIGPLKPTGEVVLRGGSAGMLLEKIRPAGRWKDELSEAHGINGFRPVMLIDMERLPQSMKQLSFEESQPDSDKPSPALTTEPTEFQKPLSEGK